MRIDRDAAATARGRRRYNPDRNAYAHVRTQSMKPAAAPKRKLDRVTYMHAYVCINACVHVLHTHRCMFVNKPRMRSTAYLRVCSAALLSYSARLVLHTRRVRVRTHVRVRTDSANVDNINWRTYTHTNNALRSSPRFDGQQLSSACGLSMTLTIVCSTWISNRGGNEYLVKTHTCIL